ncbi:MAG: NAD(P)/FAD-dependent oxidoreductase [Hydrogenoanaerobacterium sp.]
MTLKKYDVLVVGAGAAGTMAAGAAAGRGLKTALLERNERIARKVMITGPAETPHVFPSEVVA